MSDDLVAPVDVLENMKWRRYLNARGFKDKKFAKAVRDKSSRDCLFFINSFAFAHDPRRVKRGSTTQPFICYEFQEYALREIVDSVGDHDLCCEKSRDQGATWLFLLSMLWYWLFFEGLTFNLMSRSERLVDDPDNMNALMPKIDFALKHLPAWLFDRQRYYSYTFLKMVNKRTNSVFKGFSTTGDAARAGRATAAFMDELAFFEQRDGHDAVKAMQKVTDSRLFCSTPNGTGNAFFDVKQSNVAKIRMHWADHPEQNQGLYRVNCDTGEIEILDREYEFPDDYEFNARFANEFSLRSVYFDRECDRAQRVQDIRQELEIDYLGSGSPFFSQGEIEKAVDNFARPCVQRIDVMRYLDLERADIRRIEYSSKDDDDVLLLWDPLGSDERPSGGTEYCLAADVSSGTGATNSVLSVGCRRTMRMVGLYVTSCMDPYKFGSLAVALGRFFNGDGQEAYLIWEANGPGRTFERAVLDHGYDNIYFKEHDQNLYAAPTSIPGWYSSRDSKRILLTEYAAALNMGKIIIPDERCIREMGEFHYFANAISHVKAMTSPDPSAAKDNHGDRVISNALLWRGLRRSEVKAEARRHMPVSCLKARMMEREEKERAELKLFDYGGYMRDRKWRNRKSWKYGV